MGYDTAVAWIGCGGYRPKFSLALVLPLHFAVRVINLENTMLLN